jgi:hypothetical protein
MHVVHAPKSPAGDLAERVLFVVLSWLIHRQAADLLTRLEALLTAWRAGTLILPPIPQSVSQPGPSPLPLRARTASDGTHLVCEHPILWVIGPGPNRGLRPTPRATPIPRPRVARAPPRASIRPHAQISAKPPPTGGRSRTPIARVPATPRRPGTMPALGSHPYAF